MRWSSACGGSRLTRSWAGGWARPATSVYRRRFTWDAVADGMLAAIGSRIPSKPMAADSARVRGRGSFICHPATRCRPGAATRSASSTSSGRSAAHADAEACSRSARPTRNRSRGSRRGRWASRPWAPGRPTWRRRRRVLPGQVRLFLDQGMRCAVAEEVAWLAARRRPRDPGADGALPAAGGDRAPPPRPGRLAAR